MLLSENGPPVSYLMASKWADAENLDIYQHDKWRILGTIKKSRHFHY